jgi:hypothetical protein
MPTAVATLRAKIDTTIRLDEAGEALLVDVVERGDGRPRRQGSPARDLRPAPSPARPENRIVVCRHPPCPLAEACGSRTHLRLV